MGERWKSPLDGRTDGPKGHDGAENDVTHDGSPHEATDVVLALEVGGDEDGGPVRPRYRVELVLPTRPDVAHVVHEYKDDWNVLRVQVTVCAHRLKRSGTIIQHFVYKKFIFDRFEF